MMRTDPVVSTPPESYAFRFRRRLFFRVTTFLEVADSPAHSSNRLRNPGRQAHNVSLDVGQCHRNVVVA